MTNLCSIVIPVSGYHEQIAQRAIASAEKQTLKCTVIPFYDTQQRGAGFARNRGSIMVDSLFIVFLDADDYLEPHAVEYLLRYWTPKHYVYCDDLEGESYHATEDCEPYHDGTWHTVTTLLPTAFFRAVGGFDETLAGFEDGDLYLRLQASGVCGIRCPHGVLHYSGEGQRSKTFRETGNSDRIRARIYTEWGGLARIMCSCQGTGGAQPPDEATKRDGDVLVQSLDYYQQHVGPATGRIYPRAKGWQNYQQWVSPLDVSARPDLWKEVKPAFDPAQMSPDIMLVDHLAKESFKQAELERAAV